MNGNIWLQINYKLNHSTLNPKEKLHTSRLSARVKNLYIKGLCKSSLDHTDVWAIPLVSSDNSIGPPICPVNIIAKKCNCKWMWQHFMASRDFPMIRAIIKCCVNGVWSTQNKNRFNIYNTTSKQVKIHIIIRITQNWSAVKPSYNWVKSLDPVWYIQYTPMSRMFRIRIFP